MEAYVRHLGSEERGVLRVSSDSLLCFPWLPGAIRRFRRRHPRVRVHLTRHGDLLGALRKRALDVGLTYPRDPGSGLETTRLFSDEMLAVLPPLHPLTAKRAIAVADLAGSDFIYHMELRESVLFRRYLAPGRVELGSFTLIEQPDAILAMVRAGLGVTLLPRWSVTRDEATGAVATRPLRGKGGFRVQWSAAIRRGEEPLARVFTQAVRAEAAARRSCRADSAMAV